MRTLRLTDDTCFSGIRKPYDYRHTGGGYIDPIGPNRPSGTTDEPFAEGELAAIVVGHSTPRDKQGRYTRGLDINVTPVEPVEVAA